MRLIDIEGHVAYATNLLSVGNLHFYMYICICINPLLYTASTYIYNIMFIGIRWTAYMYIYSIMFICIL